MTQYHIAPHKPTVIRIGDGTPPAYAALGGDTPENLLDYAAFMVRACNSHYSILEALDKAVCLLHEAGARLRDVDQLEEIYTQAKGDNQ